VAHDPFVEGIEGSVEQAAFAREVVVDEELFG